MLGSVYLFAVGLLSLPVLSLSWAGTLVSLQPNEGALQKATRRFLTRRAASPGADPASASSPAGGDGQPTARSEELVTEVLGKIEGTNRGIDCTPEQREEIDQIIEQLNTLGEDEDWLKDPRVFGNYNVAYVSSGPSQRGNPAGGRWRGRIGRSLFKTEELFQHLVEPATAVNMVVFRAFGLLGGCVTLRGDFEAIPDRPNFVKASFGPPLINFLGKHGLTIESGPKSSVNLAATYVDDRVRLGKGGRGSLFVFTRGGAAETPQADEWKRYVAASERPAKARLLGAAVACGAAAAAARSAFLPAGALALVAAALVATRGGIIEDDTSSDLAEQAAQTAVAQ